MSDYDNFVNAPDEYRRGEILPEVWELIQRGRKRGHVITDKRIDEILKYQHENVDKCITFIGWRYLGTANYMDVFGKDAESERTIKALKEEAAALRQECKKMRAAVEQLTAQLEAARTIPAEMQIETRGSIYQVM